MSTDNSILIVDDDVDFCHALSRAFTRRGFDVYTAHNRDEAIAQLGTYKPACAVVDLKLGEESGLQVVENLKQAQPSINIVVLTGFASIASAVDAIKLGATQYLTKPVQPEQIIDALTDTTPRPDADVPQRPMSVQRLEWEHIHNVLKQHDGNISAAARALGMHRRSLQRKLGKKPARE